VSPLPRFRLYTKPASYRHVLGDVLSGRTRKGDEVEQLEEAVRSRTGADHAVCVAKARVGLFLLVRAIVEPGKEVVLSPYTISDVVNMVICAGARPVFADIDRPTTNISAEEVERLVTPETGAVLVTHLHGHACEIERITAHCKKLGVPLLEDSAQAFGTRVSGRWTGTFGEAGVYSFGMYKNVNSFFGGMVVTKHAWLAERLRAECASFPWQGIPYYQKQVSEAFRIDVATFPPLFRAVTFPIFRYGYVHDVAAINGLATADADPVMKSELPEGYLRRYTTMQARIALRQLEQVDANSHRRRVLARIYHDGLADVPDLIIAPWTEDLSATYTYYVIQHPERQALLKQLFTDGCDLAPGHFKNIAALEAYAEFNRDCLNTEATAKSLIFCPTYPRYSERDVERNVCSIRRFCGV
jgi:dTDP-4-amino-4,6-dideoxygalactose transaminase